MVTDLMNISSIRLLPENLKIKIYRTVTSPVVLYGCKTWSLVLREEYSLRMFENMTLRKWEATGRWNNFTVRSFVTDAIQHRHQLITHSMVQDII
jgi:hypothetical protein